MSFEFIQSTDEGMVRVAIESEGDFLAAMEIRGHPVTGLCRRTVLRPELQGQPMFAGACGPMWGGLGADGTPIIRYEDVRAYAQLSA